MTEIILDSRCWLGLPSNSSRAGIRLSAVFLLVVLLAAVSLCSGCRKRKAEVRILVAVSAYQTTQQCIDSCKDQHPDIGAVTIELVAGPSNGLAQQILAGAEADIFVSANSKWTDSVKDHFSAVSPMMGNQLVLATGARSKLRLNSLADAASPSVERIAIAAESVPIGDYARQAIEKLSPQDREAIQNKLVFAKDSAALVAWLENDVVDAAIIYQSDLLNSGQRLRAAASIDPSQHEPIVYTIARLKSDGPESNALADEVYRWLCSEEAMAVFEKAGFEPEY